MVTYKVVITSSVQKYLDKLSDPLADKLENAMMKLENDQDRWAVKKSLARMLTE
jgi:mRNA-degrading endonuclease RelE of RelBE toxin-antitoxin system